MGRPPTHKVRGSRKVRWKAKVAEAAAAAWPNGAPSEDALYVSITNYFTGVAPDVDNVVKSIQDALEGIVYTSDAQIVATLTEKQPIDATLVLDTMPADLQDAIHHRADVVRIRVSPASAPHFGYR